MNRRYFPDDGSTGSMTALLMLVVILSLVLYTVFIPLSFDSGKTARGEMVRATDALVPDGNIVGYSDASGTMGEVRVNNPHPAPDQLGAVRIPIKLASLRLGWEQGAGADLGNATVSFTSTAGTEILPGSSGPVLEKPSWAIVRKGSRLPGQAANGDTLLEPNEVFVLFIYPSTPLPPGTVFTIDLRIPDEKPMTISRVVPVPVLPVMNLG
jgi:hypothetical protein